MRDFFKKIAMILMFLFVYVFGHVRTYTLFAKWTTFDNKVVPFSTVLLPKNLNLCGNNAMRMAMEQSYALTVMKDSFKFDHLEPCPIKDYLEEIWYGL